MDIKVEVYRDKMILIHEGKSITSFPSKPYNTKRLLVGTFLPAVECLKEGIKKFERKGFFKPKLKLFVQACEMNEGGLCEVEKRCLEEMAFSAGAEKVEFIDL